MISLRTELTEERLRIDALTRSLKRSEGECADKDRRVVEFETQCASAKEAVELGKTQIVELSKKVCQLSAASSSGVRSWLGGAWS